MRLFKLFGLRKAFRNFAKKIQQGFDLYLPDWNAILGTGTLNTANELNLVALNSDWGLLTVAQDWFDGEYLDIIFGGVTAGYPLTRHNSSNGYLRILGSGSIRIGDTSSASVEFTHIIEANKLYRIVRNLGVNTELYEDGILVDTTTSLAGNVFISSLGNRSSVYYDTQLRYLNFNGVREYNFTEGVGDICYDSIGGNDITLQGSSTDFWTTGVDTPTQIIGTAPAIYGRHFRDTDYYVLDSGAFTPTAIKYRIQHPDGLGGDDDCIMGNDASNRIVWQPVSSRFRIEVGGVNFDYTNPSLMFDGLWHTHELVSDGGGGYNLEIDGVTRGLYPTMTTLPLVSVLFNQGQSSKPWDGGAGWIELDGVRHDESNSWLGVNTTLSTFESTPIQSKDLGETWYASNGVPANRKNKVYFDKSLSQYAVLDSQVGLTGDYFIEWRANIESTETNIFLVNLGNTNLIWMTATVLTFRAGTATSSPTFTGNFTNTGKLYKIQKNTVGGTFDLYEDNILIESQPIGLHTADFQARYLNNVSSSYKTQSIEYLNLNNQVIYDMPDSDYGTTTLVDTGTEGVDAQLINGVTWQSSFNGGSSWSSYIIPTWTDIITQTALMSWNPYLHSTEGVSDYVLLDVPKTVIPTTDMYLEINIFMPSETLLSHEYFWGQDTGTASGGYMSFRSGSLALRVNIDTVNYTFNVPTYFDDNFHTFRLELDYLGTTVTGYMDGNLLATLNINGFVGLEAFYGLQGANNYVGVIKWIDYNGELLNVGNNWGGSTIVNDIPTVIIPEDKSNLTFDVLGEAIERPYLLDGLNFTGQELHHYDSGIVVDRSAKGLIASRTGLNQSRLRPATPWVLTGDFFLEFKVYSGNASNLYVFGDVTDSTDYITMSSASVTWRVSAGVTASFITPEARGKLIRLERVGAIAKCYVDGIQYGGDQAISTSDYAPSQLGGRNTLGGVMQYIYVNMNDENLYWFNEREGLEVVDHIGTKPLALHSEYDDGSPELTAKQLNGTTDGFTIDDAFPANGTDNIIYFTYYNTGTNQWIASNCPDGTNSWVLTIDTSGGIVCNRRYNSTTNYWRGATAAQHGFVDGEIVKCQINGMGDNSQTLDFYINDVLITNALGVTVSFYPQTKIGIGYRPNNNTGWSKSEVISIQIDANLYNEANGWGANYIPVGTPTSVATFDNGTNWLNAPITREETYPQWVRSADSTTWIADDGEFVGGSTDTMWIRREDFGTTMPIASDDVFQLSTLLTKLQVVFNGISVVPDITISNDLWLYFGFVTDGFGFYKLYFGYPATGVSTLVAWGLTGDAVTAILSMFYGNDNATGLSMNGYLSQPVHFPRQLSEEEIEIVRVVTQGPILLGPGYPYIYPYILS